MKRFQPVLGAFALSCTGPIAICVAAQPSLLPQPTRFEFRSAGCGSAQAFTAKVLRRSSRIRLLSGADGGRTLVVEIHAPDASGSVLGTVKVVELDGATRWRKLKANSCEEAMEGLSLIATVTLDPESMMADPVTDQPPPPEPAPAATKARATKPPPRPKPPPLRPRRPSEPYRVSMGVAGVALLLVAPEPALGAAVSAAFELNPGATLSPLWRLSLVHATVRGVPKPVGDAHFAFTVPTLDVCPVRLGGAAFGVRPCAYAGLGLLKVWGSGASRDEEHVRPTGSGGGALWLGWRVSKVLEIFADGRAGLAFSRDELAFDGVGFYRARSLVFSAGIGVAGGFP